MNKQKKYEETYQKRKKDIEQLTKKNKYKPTTLELSLLWNISTKGVSQFINRNNLNHLITKAPSKIKINKQTNYITKQILQLRKKYGILFYSDLSEIKPIVRKSDLTPDQCNLFIHKSSYEKALSINKDIDLLINFSKRYNRKPNYDEVTKLFNLKSRKNTIIKVHKNKIYENYIEITDNRKKRT